MGDLRWYHVFIIFSSWNPENVNNKNGYRRGGLSMISGPSAKISLKRGRLGMISTQFVVFGQPLWVNNRVWICGNEIFFTFLRAGWDTFFQWIEFITKNWSKRKQKLNQTKVVLPVVWVFSVPFGLRQIETQISTSDYFIIIIMQSYSNWLIVIQFVLICALVCISKNFLEKNVSASAEKCIDIIPT